MENKRERFSHRLVCQRRLVRDGLTHRVNERCCLSKRSVTLLSGTVQLHVEQERSWCWRRKLARCSAQQGRPVQIDGRGRRRGFGPGSAGFQKRVERRRGEGEKVRSCRRCWRCELARIIDARDVRDPRDKGLGTHTSGHQVAAALARLHLASRFRLEVKWHVASNPPAERLQISGQPRDVLLLLLFWSRWLSRWSSPKTGQAVP